MNGIIFYNEPGYAKDLASLGIDDTHICYIYTYVKAIVLSFIGEHLRNSNRCAII